MAAGRESSNDLDRDAERRRNALRQVFADYRLTATDVAAGAGLPTPNAIYNFLTGRSRSLSQQTLEKIAAAIPGVTLAMLTGEGEPVGPGIVTIRSEAHAGRYRESADLPLREQVGVSLPLSLFDSHISQGPSMSDGLEVFEPVSEGDRPWRL